MAKGRGGKRPGAGRKEDPEKAVKFSARIAPETFSAIEFEAREAKKPTSRMAELLIRRGLKAKRDAERNDATRAICYLLGELAEIVAPKQMKTEKFACDWRSDPFLFEALKLSFVKLMDGLRPAGEAITPVERDPQLEGTTVWGSLDSIDARAERAATILLHNLNAAREPKNLKQNIPSEFEKQGFDTVYALRDAWNGLNEGKQNG